LLVTDSPQQTDAKLIGSTIVVGDGFSKIDRC